MLFGSNTPTPEFRGNSRERGPRSPEGTRQGSDPPLGVHRSAPRHTGRGGGSRLQRTARCAAEALAARPSRQRRGLGGEACAARGRRPFAGAARRGGRNGRGKALAACGRTLGLSRARRAGWATGRAAALGATRAKLGPNPGRGCFGGLPV